MRLVFLRILEYYPGILFLTTNRVGALDDAFRSRLHLTLYYPKLNQKQIQKIFNMNFERIEEINTTREKKGFLPFLCNEADKKKIMKWSKDNWTKVGWNGRQIRNAFQTVLCLSEFSSKRKNGKTPELLITKRLFAIVANASIQFNEYLLATHGADEEKVAKREYVRAMNWAPSPELAFPGFAKGAPGISSSSSSSSSPDSSSESGSESGSDDSDESDKEKKSRKKKKEKAKGSQGSKKGSKKSKSSGKSGKSEKKVKEKKEDTESD